MDQRYQHKDYECIMYQQICYPSKHWDNEGKNQGSKTLNVILTLPIMQGIYNLHTAWTKNINIQITNTSYVPANLLSF